MNRRHKYQYGSPARGKRIRTEDAQGNLDAAMTLQKEAELLCCELGDKRALANVLGNKAHSLDSAARDMQRWS